MSSSSSGLGVLVALARTLAAPAGAAQSGCDGPARSRHRVRSTGGRRSAQCVLNEERARRAAARARAAQLQRAAERQRPRHGPATLTSATPRPRGATFDERVRGVYAASLDVGETWPGAGGSKATPRGDRAGDGSWSPSTTASACSTADFRDVGTGAVTRGGASTGPGATYAADYGVRRCQDQRREGAAGPGVEGSRCLMPARSAPARRGKPRARRAAPRPAWPHLPELEQRQLDLIGLGLIALAVFFGFLVYGGMDGGRAGGWTVDSLRWLLGAVHYAVPAALLAAGAILVLRPCSPRCARSARARSACSPRSASAWRPARSVSAPRAPAPASGIPPGCARTAAWWGRRSTGPARRCSAASARTSSPCSCSSRACCCSRARPSRAW